MHVYERLGLTPNINTRGMHTRMGGTLMPDPVVKAMVEAAQSFISIVKLQERIGAAIAEMTHNEAAYVSCGATAGITLAIAACMTGKDPEKIERLPDTQGMNNEVIVQRGGRFYEDIAIQIAGAKIIEIGDYDHITPDDLTSAITDQTAAIFSIEPARGVIIPIEKTVEIAHAHDIPVIVDAAFGVPPKENLWRITRDMGADIVVVSGGKGIRGPQTTGLILGRREIIEACTMQGNPFRGIGRPMKVGKEEMAGLYAAVEHFMMQDDQVVQANYDHMADFMIRALSSMPHVTAERERGGHRVIITLDEPALGMTEVDMRHELREGKPSIEMGDYILPMSCYIDPITLQEGEEQIVIHRIQEILENNKADHSTK
jgi:D-glucosaminate-6-phosphate ammonia-lyase